jgi:hypothetical protein
LHLVYGAATLIADTDIAFTSYPFPDVDLSTRQVDHPMQAGSKVIPDTSKAGYNNWVHLEFPANSPTIVPDPLAATNLPFFSSDNIFSSPDPNGDIMWGVRIFYSTKDPGASVPADYVDIKPAHPTYDFKGLGAITGEWGLTGSNVFVNHDTIDVEQYPNTHYSTQPMIGPDALCTGGIPVKVHYNSWSVPGPGPSVPIPGSLPTPATVVSFDASFDPRTGKVTLNWKSAAEQSLDGYNVWRQLNLDGRPLGDKVLVGFVPAKGPSEYTLTDEPDVKKFARLARGRPIEATYSLEEVNTDGTTNVIKTTSVQLSKNRGRRSR